jgi:hypothetical protein
MLRQPKLERAPGTRGGASRRGKTRMQVGGVKAGGWRRAEGCWRSWVRVIVSMAHHEAQRVL